MSSLSGQKCGYARVLARSDGAFKSRDVEKQAVPAAAVIGPSRPCPAKAGAGFAIRTWPALSSVFDLGSLRSGRRLNPTRALGCLTQPLEHHVEYRDEENPEDRRCEHTAEDRGA